MPQKPRKLTNKKVGEPQRGSQTVKETMVHRPARGSHPANVVDHRALHGSRIPTRVVGGSVVMTQQTPAPSEEPRWPSHGPTTDRTSRPWVGSETPKSGIQRRDPTYVSGKGIEIDDTKVKAIRDLPTLKSVKSYCLDKVTFTEYVPWVCDECKENEITRTMNSDAVPPVTCLVEHSHVAQPVDDPIWRGCYNIRNNKYTLDGVVAHLSEKASQSVSEKVKPFQLHLRFEMVSKDDLWPKYFNTPEAIVDDIELFFFPSKARHQDKFDSMVQEMIGGEHALRASTPYGELLVFKSTELPLRHWKRYKVVVAVYWYQTWIQTPDNVLAARDVVNDRASIEDDAQVLTDELRRGKRIRKTIAKLDDYICL
ncbi:hypothetical protein MTR67_035169 [Solanum verrucosum]|uniref:AIPP2-like SPOC-like domain-containing protein n=1 Tax=Solanum verrucosum TaxID=315347 RepID=A0AAF0U9Q0_SOLVR|nr:hypothetical protein MTR67_035169 [Solanum verrucosum]